MDKRLEEVTHHLSTADNHLSRLLGKFDRSDVLDEDMKKEVRFIIRETVNELLSAADETEK